MKINFAKTMAPLFVILELWSIYRGDSYDGWRAVFFVIGCLGAGMFFEEWMNEKKDA